LDIEKVFRAKLTDYDLTYCQSTNQIFEVMAPGVTKGSAIHRLCRRMGISTDEVLVFGDGNNDVEMFDNAGISVRWQTLPIGHGPRKFDRSIQ
jgi:HAD superfamily hydrolase (TIGR01484 family)